MVRIALVSMLLAALASGQARYELPPQAMIDCVTAPPPPQVSVSPTGKHLLLVTHEGAPSIETVARPMLGLAGRRIDPKTRGPQRGARGTAMTLIAVDGGASKEIPLPKACDVGGATWAADGTRIAFTNTTDEGIELWVADAGAATCKRVDGVQLNATLGNSVRWHSDQKRLLCLIVANPGVAPAGPAAPLGPNVEEARGKKAPVRTFQDMLHSAHDEAMFEHYMTSQLVLVDPAGGPVTKLGAPGLLTACDASPDGKYLLVTKVKRPFSYRLGAQGFPKEIAVWDLAGNRVDGFFADLPNEEGVPIEGVPTGPRSVRWAPGANAFLQWVEAQDGGDPKRKVEKRDALMGNQPLAKHGHKTIETQHRFQGIQYLGGVGGMIWSELDRDRKWRRTWIAVHGAHGDEPSVLHEGGSQDAYGDIGRPVTLVDEHGDSLVVMQGTAIYLDGDGASPKGDRPFLDRYDTATKKKERLFECDEGRYERVLRLLAPDASKLLITSESKTEPPSYVVLDRASGARTVLWKQTDPVAEITKGITKQRVDYVRKDGVKLSATLYLPPGHAEGKKWPVFVWAYPREFADTGTAGQVRGSDHRYTHLSALSPLMMLLAGYAVLDDAAMPVVGPPETANDTFVAQIVDSAQAAIDKVVAMGVGEKDRFAVGGHSYGAFMTANLLAHCDLFRCGIARSGAYNRTLTPFGFQSERRTYWEAPQIYHDLSPFSYADKINEPILMIHGEADDNPGTFPVQSRRLFDAISGQGGKARLVMLPHEAHGYRARESLLHVLAEQVRWLDANLKNAQ